MNKYLQYDTSEKGVQILVQILVQIATVRNCEKNTATSHKLITAVHAL
jgi:hypothetical protein